MNNQHEFDDSRELDRLVDGELSRDEYRALLVALNEQPDGWRKCAMAFLEAQAFGQEFHALQDDVDVAEVARLQETTELLRIQLRSSVGRNVSSRPTGQLVGLMLAMAVCFALAFTGGVWWNGRDSTKSDVAVPVVVRPTDNLSPIALNEGSALVAHDEPAMGVVPTEHVTFVVDRGDGESERFELPIYDASNRFARQLLQDSPSMPEDVERAIRDSGFHVKSQRQWAPVRLQDGRRAFFPVDQLDITPVSGSSYH
ncbi:MAG: hypothetical protein H8E66_32770 [Planctomycetes bacterium]|nr:hypothetical protein [Planctomycetota bacterium]